MVEATRDLTDLLHAAEMQREVALRASSDPAPAHRARAAVRAARARRRAGVLVGAAAAVAVVVAGAVAWSPQADVAPAAPDPSSGALVPGLPPLRQADESDVRGAPVGSVVVLWVPPFAPGSTPSADAVRAAHLLLVRPDGEVLDLGTAPEGADELVSWDRAAGTAVVAFDGATGRSDAVVDLTTGGTTDAADPALPTDGIVSPDGTGVAWTSTTDVHVERDGVEVRHDSPAAACSVVLWVDDAHLLVDCPALDPGTLHPTGRPGATLLRVDAATGAVVEQRAVAVGEPRPHRDAVRLDDGRAVAWLVPPGDSPGQDTVCPTRIGEVTGLGASVVAEVPGLLAPPGLVSVPGRVLVAATAACGVGGSPALWSLDTVTWQATQLLPADAGTDDPARIPGRPLAGAGTGLQSWVVGR